MALRDNMNPWANAREACNALACSHYRDPQTGRISPRGVFPSAERTAQ